MLKVSTITELPNNPSVYALYGGSGRSRYVAYVGIAKKLKNRIDQHLIRRDSSVATGTSAAHLNPDYVTEVAWWEHDEFKERHFLEAAEMVASGVLDPALRSRGRPQQRAVDLLEDGNFVAKMEILSESPPTGKLNVQTLQEALERISEIERRVAQLEQAIKKASGGE